MPTINRDTSTLLVIDFQSRLLPAIDDAATVIANARRLLDAAAMFEVPVLFTEQNADGLGRTLAELRSGADVVTHKMTFNARLASGFSAKLPERPDIVVAGCEAHVCVLQTVMGLLGAGRRIFVVRDALGSRRAENKETAIRRMERNGAEILTTEMVIFEWLGTAEDPRLGRVLDLVK